jgi:hypothetical protein
MPPAANSLPLDGPYPQPIGPQLSLVPPPVAPVADGITVKEEDGVLTIEHEDGSVTIDFEPDKAATATEDDTFSQNIAKKLSEGRLSEIATDLIEGIEFDEKSREEWLQTRALGIGLLGLKLENPRSDTGSGGAPLEGISTVRHPLLLEATVSFQATARAELLPASGQVKVRNDSSAAPKQVFQGTNAVQELKDSIEDKDELAQALEKDMNHYLTAIATEYIPDTDRMLFYVGFGGDGFKKVYNCPLRRRPVSESIDAGDLIISNAATDIRNSGRVTHRIKMRQSVLKRMQILGVYRDVELSKPQFTTLNEIEKKKEEISGVSSNLTRPKDRDYEIYETYCELDLEEFAPKKFKGKGLPLPYRVTIEKESRQVLDIRRNWAEDDEECLAKQYFVQFPFIRGLGFYGLGYIHLLGNTTNTLTGAWREMLDAGMFANFPGFLYSKPLGRQLTNQFRVPPGGGIAVDVPAQQKISDSVMPLPYREPGAGFTSFITHIEELGQRLASTATIAVGEGKQDAPVGTTLALIEQATKVMDSAHKRLHAAQAEEFKLLKERFREDPEAFWRHNKKPTKEWKKEQFIEAINANELVPVADPNNPTSLHRIAKAIALKTLEKDKPTLYDPIAVDMRVLRIINIDPSGLFRPFPAPPPPDPRLEAVKAKAQGQQQTNMVQFFDAQIRAKTEEMKLMDKAKDRASREMIERLKYHIEAMKVQQAQVIHMFDAEKQAIELGKQMELDELEFATSLRTQATQEMHKIETEAMRDYMAIQRQNEKDTDDNRRAEQQHQMKLRQQDDAAQAKLRQQEALSQQKIAAARAMAKAKPKPKKKAD